jgi:hypothetical protein
MRRPRSSRVGQPLAPSREGMGRTVAPSASESRTGVASVRKDLPSEWPGEGLVGRRGLGPPTESMPTSAFAGRPSGEGAGASLGTAVAGGAARSSFGA